MVAVVPLVPDKAREGAGAWLLLWKCRTVPRATIGAASVLLLRTLVGTVAVVATAVLMLGRRCTVAAVVASHERFRTIAMTTTVLRRRTRDIIAGAATVALRWGGKGWQVGIYAIALEEAIAAQMPKLTTGVAESVALVPRTSSPHAWLVCIARTRFPKLGRRNVAAVPSDLLRRFCRLKKEFSTNQCTNLDCFRSRRPCSPTSACAVYESLE